tara:strand:+ start:197 stop:415 length:219 start_codon:yes stop_codon:yes gene_type:complete
LKQAFFPSHSYLTWGMTLYAPRMRQSAVSSIAGYVADGHGQGISCKRTTSCRSPSLAITNSFAVLDDCTAPT